MSLQPGTRLGNYEVLSELGSGGMGEVYKAKDLKLGRVVAIKVLPQEMASDSQRLRRFEQEARAASALNHPNIITIYEIGEYEGTPYIAMEYVEGQTLRELVATGPLPNDKLLRYATQMAEGLAKAHLAGIVHRDLKPENIVVSKDGYVKILDFGLAKLMPSHVDAEMRTMERTKEGVIVGTVQYMSPEQASGSSVDFRSDQFSLGCILFEMATGKLAFKRDTAAETLTAIIREELQPVTFANPKVSAGTARVINRCLAKDPKDRYDSTGDIAKDIHWEELAKPEQPTRRHPLAAVGAVGILAIVLVMILGLFDSDIRNWVAGGPDAPRIDSIAVLPLENLSGDPEQEYFADGMTEALITNLAKIGALKVISRSSAARFKGTSKPLFEIARELDVDAVLEGSALRAEDRVRITAQLIDPKGDRTLWAESYERDFRDILSLQSEVARAIATEIEAKVTPQEQLSLARVTPVNPGAYEAYLRGRYFWYKRTSEGLEKAVGYFRRATELDPGSALPYVGLADSYNILGYQGLLPPQTAFLEAKAAASRALEIDSGLGEAHAAHAYVLYHYEWDWPAAETSFNQALELNPNHAPAHQWFAYYLISVGRVAEALAQARRAQESEPLSPMLTVGVAWVQFLARHYDRSIEENRKALELDPNFLWAHWCLGRAFEQKGMFDDAVAEFQKAQQAADIPPVLGALGHAYAAAGRAHDALRVIQQLKERALNDYSFPYEIAAVHIGMNEKDEAFDWLGKALEQHHPWLSYAPADPMFDPLRSDPRFQGLLRRMNFPE